LDDVDVRELPIRDLRRRIGLVSQDTVLFDESVMDNIRYGSPDATNEQVIAAARQAHAHEFIVDSLADQYQTIVGQRGSMLSGGQRQRIALARAILRAPEILLLDEATSQIDAESERLIYDALKSVTEGRTTLLISHRPLLLSLANRIVVMDQGRVIDCGTSEQLAERCDLYKRLSLSVSRAAA
jgi:ABC-type multidrug transport system fused ATPase/permease subunit